jgi:hypothetical protein
MVCRHELRLGGGWAVFVFRALSRRAAGGRARRSAEAASEPVTAPAEVVRVKRDFGKPHFDLVIDAWADPHDEAAPDPAVVDQHQPRADRRKPLGALIERMVKLQYRRISSTSLTVAVAGDGKEFTFTVELGGDGQVHAYVASTPRAGKHIPRCRTTQRAPAGAPGARSCRSASPASPSPARTTAAPCTADRSPTASCERRPARGPADIDRRGAACDDSRRA